jgi:hypothetical protein
MIPSTVINEINKNIHLLQEEYAKVEVKKTKLETEMESFPGQDLERVRIDVYFRIGT